MDFMAIAEDLAGILEKKGIEIRSEALGGEGGGLCRLKNKTVFFLDKQASTHERARQYARAVREIMDIDSIYLKPAVREFIENA